MWLTFIGEHSKQGSSWITGISLILSKATLTYFLVIGQFNKYCTYIFTSNSSFVFTSHYTIANITFQLNLFVPLFHKCYFYWYNKLSSNLYICGTFTVDIYSVLLVRQREGAYRRVKRKLFSFHGEHYSLSPSFFLSFSLSLSLSLTLSPHSSYIYLMT